MNLKEAILLLESKTKINMIQSSDKYQVLSESFIQFKVPQGQTTVTVPDIHG